MPGARAALRENHEPPPQAQQAAEDRAVEPAVNKATVLVVDDEPANLKVFERVFRKDFTVITATSGIDALAVVQRQIPDVAFVDLRMPGMDGVAVLSALRQSCPGTSCYLLTGFGDVSETAALVDDGLCIGVLPKPWDRSAIRAAVAAALSPGS